MYFTCIVYTRKCILHAWLGLPHHKQLIPKARKHGSGVKTGQWLPRNIHHPTAYWCRMIIDSLSWVRAMLYIINYPSTQASFNSLFKIGTKFPRLQAGGILVARPPSRARPCPPLSLLAIWPSGSVSGSGSEWASHGRLTLLASLWSSFGLT